MNSNAGTDASRLPEGPPAQEEFSLMDSRAPSPTSSDNGSEAQHELWDELFDVLQAQEDEFVEQDETALPVAPGRLFDTQATPVVKRPGTPMRPKLSFQRLSVVPSLVSSPSRSSSGSPLKPHIRSLVADARSAMTNPARESPSHRFFASPDQIDVLGMPKTWIHGQVISTLGDTFCITSRLKPRHEYYDILPTDLFETWNSYVGGHSTSRTTLSFHFEQAASLLECGAWLVPVLLESHWYLLELDWIDSNLRIYDSLATSETPHLSLKKFGGALVDLITEDLKLEDNDWDMVPEQASGFHCDLTGF